MCKWESVHHQQVEYGQVDLHQVVKYVIDYVEISTLGNALDFGDLKIKLKKKSW